MEVAKALHMLIFARSARRFNRAISVVLGGAHPTFAVEDILRHRPKLTLLLITGVPPIR